MRHTLRRPTSRLPFWLPVLGVLLGAGGTRAQHHPGAPPALEWTDLLGCELVVVGQFKSHDRASIALEVVEVLRGKACKPGDVLPVKLSQAFAIKLSPRYGDPARPSAKIPHLSFVDEEGATLREFPVLYDAARPHVYFFPRARQLLVDRPSQLQPDLRDGWKQALAGKPIDLAFRLLYDLDAEMSRKAVEELFQSRERAAIAALVGALVDPSHYRYPRWIETQAFAERALVSLGDNNGDVYEPVLTALRGKYGVDYGNAFRLTRILARADSRRALSDLKKLLGPGSRVSRTGVTW